MCGRARSATTPLPKSREQPGILIARQESPCYTQPSLRFLLSTYRDRCTSAKGRIFIRNQRRKAMERARGQNLKGAEEPMDSRSNSKFSPSRTLAAALAGLTLCAGLMLAGCNKTHPDEKDAVNNALTANNLGVVTVSQDRDKGVMTLSGDVETSDLKQRAEEVAKQAAPDYTVSNQVGVRPVGNESQAK